MCVVLLLKLQANLIDNHARSSVLWQRDYCCLSEARSDPVLPGVDLSKPSGCSKDFETCDSTLTKVCGSAALQSRPVCTASLALERLEVRLELVQV